MQEKRYHHGDLKKTLIEEGIAIIVNEGEDALSLRGLAKKCNVSQAAPYAHFKDKLALVHGMQEYVTNQFYDILCAAIKDIEEGTEDSIIALGVAYVNFFIDNPNYFKFLFQSPYLVINISIKEEPDSYPPYELFRRSAVKLIRKRFTEEDKIRIIITNMWATVQGLCLLATSPYVIYNGDMKKDVQRILSNI